MLGKSFPTPSGPSQIVQGFNLKIAQGEFVCLLGHSGCGKSTVLSIVMGLAQATEGGVIISGKEIDRPGTDRGVVFQSPALLPWLSVKENVRLAMDQGPAGKARGKPEAAARDPERFLSAVGLAGMGEHEPAELSAGMQQRVGIARAFALEPRILLLDEPFSLLDALTRMELQDTLMQLWEEEHKTVLMVTHDVDEALLLADRIVLMTRGPGATVGQILEVPFARPRRREDVLAHPEYYAMRDEVVGFLEDQA
jgi:nitrate/nitrite transport system ATP-binding protein